MPAPRTRVGISLGSNLGDRGEAIHDAIIALTLEAMGEPGEGDALISGVYETEPVDCPPGSPPFLNAFVEIGTTLTSRDLLQKLQQYERAQGRPRPQDRAVNVPRTIDLDIIYFGDEISHDPELTLPHPRAHQRRFVLGPLAELRPDLVLPGMTKPVASLLAALPEEPKARRIDSGPSRRRWAS